MLKQIYTIISVVICSTCSAQIDLECNGRDQHSIYLCCANPPSFYRIDSVDANPTNPILLSTNFPDSAVVGGISINNNLDSSNPPQTIYFVGGPNSLYYFWNGTSWTNTNNYSGSLTAGNIGGTSNHIFNLDAIGNALYRYDGNGNGTLLMSNLNSYYNVVYDVATDNLGNFYLFYTNLQKIYSFDSMGMPIDTFTTTGFPSSVQPGFAILGNRMFAIANSAFNSVDLYEGLQLGSIINFTFKKHIALTVADIATCPEAGKPLSSQNRQPLEHLTVYPNPFRSELNINIGDGINANEVLLYDLSSRIILKQSFFNFISINTIQLEKGIYFYEVRNKNVVIKKGKVVKE
jgi:hypothetical protein